VGGTIRLSTAFCSEAALYPPSDGEANGTDIIFRWMAATDPDGDAIGDYHFELSSRPDLRWPLSMCFYKLISRTADATKEKGKDGSADKVIVKPQYTLAQAGLLTPDQRYYWRVRAMDDEGVWDHGAGFGASPRAAQGTR